MIKHQYQPPKSRMCGQTCVAMLLGMTLEECIKLVFKGYDKGTTTKHLMKVLDQAGYMMNYKKLVKVPKDGSMPDRAIVKLRRTDVNYSANWHWVLYADGRYYDPGKGGTFNSRIELEAFYWGTMEVSSMIHLIKKGA